MKGKRRELGSEKKASKAEQRLSRHIAMSLVFYVVMACQLSVAANQSACRYRRQESQSEREKRDDMKFRQDGLVSTRGHRQQVLHASILHCIRHAGNRRNGRQAMELTASCCPGVLDAKALGRVRQGSRSSPNCSI